MSTTPKPLVLMITLLMITWVPTAMANDSDGDGVNDSSDAFPNDPCADTDTDGDGMPDTISCPSSSGIVAYTSFEEPFTNGSKYFDTGSGQSDYFLWNNIDQPHVAHNQTNGSEMGFTTYYTSTGSVGLTDGDYFGTANYAGTVGNYTDGNQGYQMGDVDGIATLILDDVTADFVTFDFYVQGGSSNSYEASDNLIIRFVGSSSTVELLNVSGATGSGNNGGFAPYMGVWTSFSSNISSLGQVNLEFELNCNSQTESVYIDNVTFSSTGSSTTTTNLVEDDDDDNDGYLDVNDVFPLDSSEWGDNDGDGIGDNADADDDNDGVDDSADDFPLDPSEWTDTDGDGIGNNADTDDDDDGVYDTNDAFPLDPNESSDADGDGQGDNADQDDDNDGVDDTNDQFPLDPNEDTDTDGDGIGNNADTDDDNDGYSDATEDDCGSDPLSSSDIPSDTDGDGTCDALDVDDDGDGVINSEDEFPLDPNEWADNDGDGVGDNADTDDDGDGYDDPDDDFPLDSSEWTDTDGDAVGDNEDLDDDGDLYLDSDEIVCGSDPLSANVTPADYDLDSDGICDVLDTDNDNDGVEDENDLFPLDPTENADNDGDGIGDFSDSDDDNDGWMDNEEPNCGTDPNDASDIPVDSDGDGICDSQDTDTDGDGYDDHDDCAPQDSNDWLDTDDDDLCDSQDNDDDGDLWPDDVEANCGSDSLDSGSIPADLDEDGMCDMQDQDDDGDGFGDDDDAFSTDPLEWHDSDGDGVGDNTDIDDDDDGWTDNEEISCNSDSLDSSSVPNDIDGDDICDYMDPDNTDGPEYVDTEDNNTPGFGVVIGTLAILCAAMFVGRRQQ